MFDVETRREIERVARSRGWEMAALLAVVEVESSGKAFALVDGRKEPLIRFEGHYFDRRLAGDQRDQARKAGLANPKTGAVKNPASQAARWKLLRKAMAIDERAALESVSWGVGQVMGAHWQKLGYGSVQDLVLDARNGVYGQVRLMAGYIAAFGLAQALNKHDWRAFAKGYNGPNYAAGGYHTKIAAAYARYAKLPALPPVAPKPTEKPASAQEAPPTADEPSKPASASPAPPLPPKKAAKELSKSKRFWTWLSTGGGTAILPFVDWRVQMLIAGAVIALAVYAIATMPEARALLGRLVGKTT